MPSLGESKAELSQEEEEEQDKFVPNPSDPADVTFAKVFTNNGGKFFYCDDQEDFYGNFKHLIQESGWKLPYCSNDSLKEILKPTELDFEDIQGINDYKGWPAYGRSKLMNIMFTYECHRRFSDSGVTFNCLHPGFVDSSFGNNNRGFAKNSIKIAKMIFAIDMVKGAKTSVYLSSSDDVAGISGKYFDKCKAVQSSKASYIEEDQKQLWEATEELIDSLQIN